MYTLQKDYCKRMEASRDIFIMQAAIILCNKGFKS